MNFARDFVSKEERVFNMHLGTTIASALSGFVAGVFAASIIFATVLYFSGLIK